MVRDTAFHVHSWISQHSIHLSTDWCLNKHLWDEGIMLFILDSDKGMEANVCQECSLHTDEKKRYSKYKYSDRVLGTNANWDRTL